MRTGFDHPDKENLDWGLPPCCSNCGFPFNKKKYYSNCPNCGHNSVTFL